MRVVIGLFLVSSPFEVKIGSEAGPQQVRAWGPGLESGVVGKSADFVVEAVGDDVGTLGMFHLLSSVCLNSIQLYFLNPKWFCKFSIQVSQWRAHPRLRSNVMIRETAPVTWGTGPQNRANMLFMCSVRMRTSSSALSWLKSCLLQEKTSTLTR